MATNKAKIHLNGNKENVTGLDWPHAPETDIQYYKTGTNIEPTGQEEL